MLPGILVLTGCLLAVLAGPARAQSLDTPILPRFGDPLFQPLPKTAEVGRFDFRSDPASTSEPAWFEEGPLRRLAVTGGLSFSYSRTGQAVQGRCTSFIYERSAPTPEATEVYTLVGDVIIALPEGTLAAPEITLTISPTQFTVVATGGMRAEFQQQILTAQDASLNFPPGSSRGETALPRSGQINGAVTIHFTLEKEEIGLESADPDEAGVVARARPLFAGGILPAQQVELTGERFNLTFNDQGVEQLSASLPSVMRLQESVPDQPPVVGEPQVVVIETAAFAASFATSDLGTRLSQFSAPSGITLHYPNGTISAARGDVDLRAAQQRLEFEGQVSVAQEGAAMVASRLILAFDPAGQVHLEATGRPTFRFSSANFRPLAEMLGNFRPGAGKG